MQRELSIIIPAFNKSNSITKTIDSIVTQKTNINYEIIVINDGSTDNTADIVTSINHPNIKLISQENKGVSAARNRGIKEAVGTWILFIDADDILECKFFNFIECNLNQKADIIIGNFRIITPANRIITWTKKPLKGYYSSEKLFKKWYYKRFFIRSGNFIVKRSILPQNFFKENLTRFEDVEAYLNLIRTPHPVFFVDHIFMNYIQANCEASLVKEDKFDNDYCSNMQFNGHSFWEKLILAEIISVSLKEYHNKANYLKDKYAGISLYLIINRMLKPFKYITRKIYGIWASAPNLN